MTIKEILELYAKDFSRLEENYSLRHVMNFETAVHNYVTLKKIFEWLTKLYEKNYNALGMNLLMHAMSFMAYVTISEDLKHRTLSLNLNSLRKFRQLAGSFPCTWLGKRR